jgi:prolyl-tRNA synthetase
MTHGDDDGLILPPRLAPKHVVILPIYRSDEERGAVLDYCQSLASELGDQRFGDGRIEVEIDDRDIRGGEKNWQHIKRGVPLRVEVGPKDIAKNAVFVGRRDTGEKTSLPRDAFVAGVARTLDDIQSNLFNRAVALREEHSRTIDNLADFRDYFTPSNEDKPEIHGGFATCHFVEEPAVEELLKDLKVTIRCVPIDGEEVEGQCLFTGKPTRRRAIFAKAY